MFKLDKSPHGMMCLSIKDPTQRGQLLRHFRRRHGSDC